MLTLLTLYIPHKQFSRLRAAARSQPRSVWTPGHARDHTVVSCKLLTQYSGRSVPHIYDTIITPSGYQRTIRTPSHLPHPSRKVMLDPAWMIRCHVEDL